MFESGLQQINNRFTDRLVHVTVALTVLRKNIEQNPLVCLFPVNANTELESVAGRFSLAAAPPAVRKPEHVQ